jgi:hypothetical protein
MTGRQSLILLSILLGPLPAFAAEKPQWIVVTAPAFRAALEPLCKQRQAEGMQVVIVQTTAVLDEKEILAGDADKLAARVHKLCKDHEGTSYVLLVGAVEAGKLTDPSKKVVPPLRGTISRMKNQPTDNGYGCLDGERLPTVAVGRFPARSEEEVKQMVEKILAYELDTQPGEWRQRITVLAGVPAFNPLVDRLVESMAMSRFARLDPRWSVRAIYHNPSSRFCVPDDQLHDRSLQYVREGQALTLYLGHSWAEGFYAPRTRFMDRKDWAELKIARGPGIFGVFGCNGCQLCGEDGEGFGIAAMRNPSGPVAVLGSHGICFAAMCQLAADGVLDTVSTGKSPERVAEVLLKLKEGIAQRKMDDLTFKMLDMVDGDGKISQATQRQEHLEMFLLLGDPALRLPRITESIQLAVTGEVKPGGTITVKGAVPKGLHGSMVRLALERQLTSDPLDLQSVPREPAAERNKVMLANHERANRFVLSEQRVPAPDGRFEIKLQLPDKLPWPQLLLRAYAVTDRTEALGIHMLTVVSGQ